MRALGDLIVRRPKRVLVAWAVLTIVGLGLAGGLSDRLLSRGFGVPGSGSSTARDLEERHVRNGDATGLTVALTSERPARAALEREAARISAVVRDEPDVLRVGATIVAPDARAALVPFLVDLPQPDPDKRIADLQEALPVSRVDAHVVGDAAAADRYAEIAREDLARAEKLSFPAPMLLLLLAFLSVVAAGLPIVSAVVALAVTFGGLYLVASATSTSVFATNTAIVLGIGLSIDFALFMVVRFRELLGGGASVDDAVRAAVQTTGRAIVTSAVTIGGSLAALFIVGMGLFTSMAIGAMLSTFAAMLTSVTLVPAMLALLGPRVDRLSLSRAARAASEARLWHRLGALVVRRRVLLATGSTFFLIALAVPLLAADLSVRTIAVLPDDDPLRVQTDRVADSFGDGVVSPVEIMTRDPRAAAAVAQHVEGIRTVRPPVRGAERWSLVDAILDDPIDSRDAEGTVRRLRAELAAAPTVGEAHVGGQTAQNLDLTERVEDRTPAVVIAALLAATLVLAVGLRSLVVPLKAVITTALSTGASLGLVTLLFQVLGSEPGLAYFVPLLLFAIVFGLSIDYEVFLLSRVREEYLKRGENDRAIRDALVRTGRSISLAGSVMVTVFLVFAASSLVPFQQLGIGLAVAVLLDATLVRAVLVPATLALLGDLNWWFPRRRARAVSRPA